VAHILATPRMTAEVLRAYRDRFERATALLNGGT
jgi:hypothetical protein